MSGTNRRAAGKYSPSEGFVLPADGFTGSAMVDCPADVGPKARGWWADWATSQYAHFFGQTEWRDLHDTAILMHHFYETGNPRFLSEARQHKTDLFGLAARMRLHIGEETPAVELDRVPAMQRRLPDPRLRSA